ncbi:MAG: cell division protein ZapA [Alphaproteobacteria bacterium]
MAEITLKINQRGYGVHCDAGQEERLCELASYVDSRLQGIAAAGAASNESHLLVLTSLVMADEVFDLRAELEDLTKQMADLKASGEREAAQDCTPSRPIEDEALIVEAIDYLANKIQAITGRLQIPEEYQTSVERAA